jgi:hypothetical protein
MAFFQDVLEDKLVFGNPGVPYVVSGLKSNQLKESSHWYFDRISRSEQVTIEHVNNFVKKCKILEDQTIHSSVAMGAGFYNYMFTTFQKYWK